MVTGIYKELEIDDIQENDLALVTVTDNHGFSTEAINKQHAIEIINHLTSVFGINSGDCIDL